MLVTCIFRIVSAFRRFACAGSHVEACVWACSPCIQRVFWALFGPAERVDVVCCFSFCPGEGNVAGVSNLKWPFFFELSVATFVHVRVEKL